MPIGFPLEDVFRYDPSLMPVVEENYQNDPSVWERLTPWDGSTND